MHRILVPPSLCPSLPPFLLLPLHQAPRAERAAEAAGGAGGHAWTAGAHASGRVEGGE